MTVNEQLPVNVLYDKDKVDENSNIEPLLVVPVGTARTRSNNDHEVGRRLYEQALVELTSLRNGFYRGIPLATWRERLPHFPLPTVAALETKLRILAIEAPDKPGLNHIDSHVLSVLRLSGGIKGFRSTQATQSLAARAGGTAHGEGPVGSLTGVQHNPAPQTTVQIAVGAAKDAGPPAANGFKKLVGWNGR